jgi:hypothetical protein
MSTKYETLKATVKFEEWKKELLDSACVASEISEDRIRILEYATWENHLDYIGSDIKWQDITDDERLSMQAKLEQHFYFLDNLNCSCFTDKYYIDFDFDVMADSILTLEDIKVLINSFHVVVNIFMQEILSEREEGQE